MRRRDVLIGLGAGVVALPLLGVTGIGVLWARADRQVLTPADGGRELWIPPLAKSTVVDGRRVFDLRVQAGQRDLGGPAPTPTWGVNGDYLGPTLRLRRGEHVQVDVSNGVDETTTMHWHGMHLPARMDGGPHQPIAPGATWRPDWVVDQAAATLWYHPHPHGESGRQVYRGVAGMVIVDDEDSDGLGLPDTYGVDDVPVIITDMSLDSRGRLDEGTRAFAFLGIVGDRVLANGTPAAFHDVGTELVRLRVLNACTTRSHALVLTDPDGGPRDYTLVGTDGGLLATPRIVDEVVLSPGERAELVIGMTPGATSTLRSVPVDLGLDPWNARRVGAHDTHDVLQLRAADSLRPSQALPDRLVDLVTVPTDENTPVRRFELIGNQINGRTMDHRRIDEVIEAGSTEIWEVTNGDGSPHNFHVHDVQFTVLDPAADKPTHTGWKDTVYVPPGETLQLAIRFGRNTDPDVPYMYHCHLLLHENTGMMGQFVIVKPDQADRAAATAPNHPTDDPFADARHSH